MKRTLKPRRLVPANIRRTVIRSNGNPEIEFFV
jgi:hypothetical protein